MRGVRALFFTTEDFFLYRFRLPLMRSLREQGAEVWAVTPPGPFASRFSRHGIHYIPLTFYRERSFHIGQGLKVVRRLHQIVRDVRPHLVHAFAHRANAYAGLASRLARVPVFIATVTGLGTLYLHNDVRTLLRRWMMEVLLRPALWGASAVVFENPDDRTVFLRRWLVQKGRAVVVPGAGVDVQYFSPHAIPEAQRHSLRKAWGIPDRSVLAVMVARYIRDKGVIEFLEAARQLQGRVWFALLGRPDPGNPSSLDPVWLQHQAARWGVLLPGFQEDVRPWLAAADLFVLPSYREGLSLALLEALAMGLPVVTTDAPGCRHAVQHGWNGLLIPPRDAKALAQAIWTLAQQPDLRQQMAKRSRQRAVQEFSQERIVHQYLQLYRHLLSSEGVLNMFTL